MIGRLIAALVIVAATLMAAASAAESGASGLPGGNDTDPAFWAEQVKIPQPKPAKRGQEWWRAVVAQHPSCGVVSNGCQTCFPGEDSFTCSNPGIACVASETWICGQ